MRKYSVHLGQRQPALSESRNSSLGDVKFILSYQGLLPTHNLGVQLGLKLPTSLQAGTGSTDLIAGAYISYVVG